MPGEIDTGLLKFHPEKCKILTVGKLENIQRADPYRGGVPTGACVRRPVNNSRHTHYLRCSCGREDQGFQQHARAY